MLHDKSILERANRETAHSRGAIEPSPLRDRLAEAARSQERTTAIRRGRCFSPRRGDPSRCGRLRPSGDRTPRTRRTEWPPTRRCYRIVPRSESRPSAGTHAGSRTRHPGRGGRMRTSYRTPPHTPRSDPWRCRSRVCTQRLRLRTPREQPLQPWPTTSSTGADHPVGRVPPSSCGPTPHAKGRPEARAPLPDGTGPHPSHTGGSTTVQPLACTMNHRRRCGPPPAP